MTPLDQIIAAAFASEGSTDKANKFYLAFLQSTLFIPIKKDISATEQEPFIPLSTYVDGHYFMLGFDTLARLKNWAGEHGDKIDYVELMGQDVVAGLNEQVYFALNVGEVFHKEFSPDEIKHLKKMVAKITSLKQMPQI